MKNKELTLEPININPFEKDEGDKIIFCPIDCGTTDVCASCDGVCRPKTR